MATFKLDEVILATPDYALNKGVAALNKDTARGWTLTLDTDTAGVVLKDAAGTRYWVPYTNVRRATFAAKATEGSKG